MLGGCVLTTLRVRRLLGQWVCLEINMLCIIPVLVYTINEDAILSGVKYFISQSAASLLFILSLFLFREVRLALNLIVITILFKLGLPPIQRWLTRILPTIGLTRIYLIFTVQKVIPLALLRFLKIRPIFLRLAIVGCIFFIFGRLGQVGSLWLLLFLSSISNGLWVLRNVGVGGQWGLFIFFYSLLLIGLIIGLDCLGISKVGDLRRRSFITRVLLGLQFINLGGLPPLLGFLIKLIIIKQLTRLSFLMLGGLVLVSLRVLFIYVYFTYKVYCFNRVCKLSNDRGLLKSLRVVTLSGSGLGLWFLN